MAEVVHVMVGWNDDYEQFYFDTCEPGIADGEPHQHEGDVPAELWARYMGAFDTLRDCERQMAELLDVEDGAVRRQACDWYRGERTEAAVLAARWFVVMPASGNDEEWPVRPVTIGVTFDTEQEADEFLAGLADELWLVTGHAPPRWIRREQLQVECIPERELPARWDLCTNCGRELADHEDNV